MPEYIRYNNKELVKEIIHYNLHDYYPLLLNYEPNFKKCQLTN